MKEHFRIAILMTLTTTVIFGLGYPLAVTALAQLFFPAQANGRLLRVGGQVVGSQLLGQTFSSPGYFRSRPSAAGDGYDAGASSGSNLGPTSKQLLRRVSTGVEQLHAENAVPVPIDLVTTSGSGLDPDISPAAAEFQVPRVARERGMTEADVRLVVQNHVTDRQFGLLGEVRVNVVELNLDLDSLHPKR